PAKATSESSLSVDASSRVWAMISSPFCYTIAGRSSTGSKRWTAVVGGLGGRRPSPTIVVTAIVCDDGVPSSIVVPSLSFGWWPTLLAYSNPVKEARDPRHPKFEVPDRLTEWPIRKPSARGSRNWPPNGQGWPVN
ncbi:hypothetical protein THAOC_37550, partial [Thalassiosira oceanica]